MQLKPGHRLGRYELVSAVGAGGMGRVWAARDTLAPGMRLVAVKTALSEAASDPEAERLFTDEARVASLVQHPNVCPVYELGKEHGALYLVMAWCDGGSLREILSNTENQRLAPELAAGLVARVAAGLHAAHELTDADGSPLGVVHRDVSPQNILITSAGHVMVADFGIARARGQLHRPTETGEIKGKLSYLSPEQITTRECDRRADVFAAGCVLYEASVGVRAFHGTDALATMYQILEQGPQPPSQVLPDYPPELERILLKALSKSADDRYQTAEALQLDLEEWLAQNRKVVSERSMADALRGAMGASVTVRNRAIQDAIEAFGKASADEATILDDTARSFSQPAPGDSQNVALTTPNDNDEPPARSRTKVVLAGVGLVTGLAAAFIAFSGKPPAPELVEPPSAAAAAAPNVATAAAPAESAALSAVTATAEVPPPTPRASASAEPVSEPSIASSSATASKRTIAPKQRTAPTPEPAVTTAPPSEPATTGTTGKRKRRTLDKDNPFATD